MKASQGGKLPILCDTSPCLMRVKETFADATLKANMFEPTEFVVKFLLDRLALDKKEESIAVHVPCSSKKMKKVRAAPSLSASLFMLMLMLCLFCCSRCF